MQFDENQNFEGTWWSEESKTGDLISEISKLPSKAPLRRFLSLRDAEDLENPQDRTTSVFGLGQYFRIPI